MKSIITLAAIAILSTLALAGCNQNASTGPTNPPATNSSVSGASGSTNLQAVNRPPEIYTNFAAGTN